MKTNYRVPPTNAGQNTLWRDATQKIKNIFHNKNNRRSTSSICYLKMLFVTTEIKFYRFYLKKLKTRQQRETAVTQFWSIFYLFELEEMGWTFKHFQNKVGLQFKYINIESIVSLFLDFTNWSTEFKFTNLKSFSSPFRFMTKIH